MTPEPASHPPGEPPVPAPKPGFGVLARTWLWGWLAITQFVLDLLLAGPYLALGALLIAGVVTIPVFLVGVPLVAVCLLFSMLLATFERARVLAFAGVPIGKPAPPRQDRPAWRRYLLDLRPWRSVVHQTVIALWGLLIGSVTTGLVSIALALTALPFYRSALPGHRISLPWHGSLPGTPWWGLVGLAALVVLPLVARGLVVVDVLLARWLLGPSGSEQVQVLSERVQTLTETREATVDSVELERRRIERDLHDGPQQRLVAIAMDLGMARERLDRDPTGARELLDKAHTASKEAITEMRQVARGIHPPVLTDRGLDAALSALAARSPVPVTVQVSVNPRPSATIEAIAYFCVSEALTNVAKHARARSAAVDVTRRDGALVVQVRDDGVGGADAARGTGLTGLRDRVRAVDGTIEVSSPPGGPTVLTAVLPERRPNRSQS